MQYIISTEQPYGMMCHMVSETRMQVEYEVFVELLINYINVNISRWYFGLQCNDQLDKLCTKLSKYLTSTEITSYLKYLDKHYWNYFTSSIKEEINYDTTLTLTPLNHEGILISINAAPPAPNPLEVVIDNICIEVEDKLYSGEYIHPKLMEIYDAKREVAETLVYGRHY